MKKKINSNRLDLSNSLEKCLYFIFKNDEILLVKNIDSFNIPLFIELDLKSLNLEVEQKEYIGVYKNIHCIAIQVHLNSLIALPTQFIFQPIRQAHETLKNNELFLFVVRAKQILYWDKSTQYCGYCGYKTIHSIKEPAKECSNCNELFFSRISPVILVLIWRNNEILLARSANFLPGIYGILAGYVEPGETVENAVIRETKEEVGINIKNLRYCGSQPWPFPSNLMLGFTAEYLDGEIQIDNTELEDAQWFSIRQLPPLPKPISLSRQIIDMHLASKMV